MSSIKIRYRNYTGAFENSTIANLLLATFMSRELYDIKGYDGGSRVKSYL